MAPRNVRHFGTTGVFYTDNLGGRNPNVDYVNEYRTWNGKDVDEGLSPSNVHPVGISSIQRGKYQFNQVATLDTTQLTGTQSDEFDVKSDYPDLQP